MKIIPKTKIDFAWVKFGPKQIEVAADKVISEVRANLKAIKSIPKEKRTFENTVFSMDRLNTDGEDNYIAFIQHVSTDPLAREASRNAEEKISKEMIDAFFDADLYKAILEYDPKSEKLSPSERRFLDDMVLSFKRQGLDLPKKQQEEVKTIRKQLVELSIKFNSNIANYQDSVLCTKEELLGLSDAYIANLSVDEKTKKYIVTLAYPELKPFMKFAESDEKRQELADKSVQKGGMENILILKKLLKLRNKLAKKLGYENYVAYVVEDELAEKHENVRSFLTNTIDGLLPRAKKDFQTLSKFAQENLPHKKLTYYSSGYIANKLEQKLFGFDQNKIKEYFELSRVMNEMFSIFGKLFGVKFRENKVLPKWHPDVVIFDLVEKGHTVGHVLFDMYPRKDKFSHMACWGLMKGQTRGFRSSEYLAPVSIIVGNFPKGNKKSPSLLSIDEVETLFHEFGHAMHGTLSRAEISSQSGTSVAFDFVETPSQLFENWVRDKNTLKRISRHYKTGKQLDRKTVDQIIASFNFMKAREFLRVFTMSLQDYEMHSTRFETDPLKLDREFHDRYFSLPQSPKSLFPASWGHMTDYAARYYSYMWAIVYAYDIFSRFKIDGVMNKKAGMELRSMILEKGDTEKAMKLVADFLGRKPNNKAFLEALK